MEVLEKEGAVEEDTIRSVIMTNIRISASQYCSYFISKEAFPHLVMLPSPDSFPLKRTTPDTFMSDRATS